MQENYFLINSSFVCDSILYLTNLFLFLHTITMVSLKLSSNFIMFSLCREEKTIYTYSAYILQHFVKAKI